MASLADINRAARTRDELLRSLLEDHQKRLRESITALERQVLRLAAKLKVDGSGGLLSDRVNAQVASQARSDLVRIFELEYNQAFVSTVVADFDKVAVGLKSYYTAANIPVTFLQADLAVIAALKQGAFQQLSVLGEEFQGVLADEIYRATTIGRPFDELVRSLQNSLRGITDMAGRPMSTRASTLAHDALVEFDATLNKKKADDAGVDTFLYFGSTVEDTREFCRRHVGEVHTEEEWEAIAARETPWQGQKSGDFFVVRGGWNCGHQLVAVLEEEEEDETEA